MVNVSIQDRYAGLSRYIKTSLMLLVACVSGCTFVDSGPVRIPVSLQQPEEMSVNAEGNARSVYVTQPFADERPVKGYCGSQKKRYGFELGVVVCDPDPAVSLGSLFARTLKDAGFSIPTAPPNNRTTPTVDGRLLQFFVEPVRGTKEFEADIHVRLCVHTASGLEAERNFYEKGRGGSYQRAVNSALRQLLTRLVDATADLLDRYPSLGHSR